VLYTTGLVSENDTKVMQSATIEDHDTLNAKPTKGAKSKNLSLFHTLSQPNLRPYG